MDTRIYIATHKQYNMPDMKGYIPLHVGREGKEELGYIGDNTGDNISSKNPNYCELTGMYWMWKNVSCDVIGLCHYRRYLLNDKSELLSVEDIETILQDYDIIITASGANGSYDTIREHYRKGHNIRDLELAGEIIKERCPKYFDSFNLSMDTMLMSFTNMMVAPKEMYDAYCEWLFGILFELENRIDITRYDAYQARVFGFLSERLLHPWLMMQEIKVYEAKYVQLK